MQKLSVLLVASSLGLASAVANASDECVAITGDKERLACYDMKYRPASTATTASAWSVQESKSKMDDSTTVILHVESEEKVPSRFGRGAVTADLYLRCSENSTSAYFILGDHFLAEIQGYGEVTYRLDAQKPKTTSMSESTDNKALGHWSGGAAIPFIKGIFGHDAMVVRITPFNESPITVTFPVSGLEEAVSPLRKACRW